MIKVLRIEFDPLYEGYELSKYYGKDLAKFHEEVLTEWNSISTVSHNVVNVIKYGQGKNETVPPKKDGFQYSMEDYFDVLMNQWAKYKTHDPDYANYEWVLNKFDLVARKNRGEFDEVHMFGAPYMGFYESCMVGRNAIWCNSPAIKKPCDNFVIMGFSYEREIPEAIEDFGHRTESVLRHVDPKFWELFAKTVGTVHVPHNGRSDYDWYNTESTPCLADMWPTEFLRADKQRWVKINKEFTMPWLMKKFGYIIPREYRSDIYTPVMRSAVHWDLDQLKYFRYWFKRIPATLLSYSVMPNIIR